MPCRFAAPMVARRMRNAVRQSAASGRADVGPHGVGHGFAGTHTGTHTGTVRQTLYVSQYGCIVQVVQGTCRQCVS